MDFSLTPEQEQFKKQVRDFVHEHLTAELRDEVNEKIGRASCRERVYGPV